jgi:hypothetical protein
MARQTINVGSSPNDGTGATLRDAMVSINSMTADIYGQSGTGDSLRGSSALSPSANLDVDFDTAQVFTMTSSITVDLNFTNASIGDVKDIIVTDSGGTSALTFDTTTNTVTTVAGTYDATAGAVNFIQVACTGANTFFLSISQSI